MDAIKLLKQDHAAVKALFEEFAASGERAHQKRKNIATRVCEELTVHASIEEEIFYPTIKAQHSEPGRKLVRESIEEHEIVKRLVDEITELDEQDEQFSAKMKVLQDVVEHHVKEEEKQMFPLASRLLTQQQLDELGDELEVQKEELQSKSQSRTRRTEESRATRPHQ